MLFRSSNASNVTFEAMLAGIAVIVVDTERTGDLVQDRENGILIPEDELERIHLAILDLLRNESLCQSLGYSASRYIRENFHSWEERLEIEVREVEQIYESWAVKQI